MRYAFKVGLCFVIGVVVGAVVYVCKAEAQPIYRTGASYSDVPSGEAKVVSAPVSVLPAYVVTRTITPTPVVSTNGGATQTTVVIVRPQPVTVNVTVQSPPTGWEAYDAAVKYRNSWR